MDGRYVHGGRQGAAVGADGAAGGDQGAVRDADGGIAGDQQRLIRGCGAGLPGTANERRSRVTSRRGCREHDTHREQGGCRGDGADTARATDADTATVQARFNRSPRAGTGGALQTKNTRAELHAVGRASAHDRPNELQVQRMDAQDGERHVPVPAPAARGTRVDDVRGDEGRAARGVRGARRSKIRRGRRRSSLRGDHAVQARPRGPGGGWPRRTFRVPRATQAVHDAEEAAVR